MPWVNLPVTDAQAEIWKLRFHSEKLLTYSEIVSICGHKAVSGMISDTLRKLAARNPENPASPEESELIKLAKAVGANDLKTAKKVRDRQVRDYRQRLRHEEFHQNLALK